jgi:hypothetical protein
MTGEFTTLTDEERLDVCEAPAQARTATRPFWHVGAGWQYQGTRLAEGAVGRGAAKLAVLTPFPDSSQSWPRRPGSCTTRRSHGARAGRRDEVWPGGRLSAARAMLRCMPPKTPPWKGRMTAQ